VSLPSRSALYRQLTALRKSLLLNSFNLGPTEENYRIRELATIVAETVPASRVECSPEGAPDRRYCHINFDKIRHLVPAFQPQWTARLGAQELCHAFRAAGLTREDFESGRYIRLAHIQRLVQAGRLDASLRWRVQGVSKKTN